MVSNSNTDEALNNSVIHYKKKYTMLRCSVSESHITRAMRDLSCDKKDLLSLVEGNSEGLKNFIKRVARYNEFGVGPLTNILYMSILSEVLFYVDIDFDIHFGFVLPTIVKDTKKYEDAKLVNYIYLEGFNGCKYHYFNGLIDGSKFTYLIDMVLEV